jgi:ribonuclease HI
LESAKKTWSVPGFRKNVVCPRFFVETGYAGAMIDLSSLREAAYRTERAASRRLAERTGVPEEQALRQTLEARAGAQGLEALLAERRALRLADDRRAADRRVRKETGRLLRQARHAGPATAWRAWFDGSARPNPGRCGIGALLLGPNGELVELSQFAGFGNSSEAEYRALIALLETAVANDAHELTIYGDSLVVVDDVNGTDDAAAPVLQPYRAAVHTLISQLGDVRLRWVPRHKNTQADALSQRAATLSMNEATDEFIPD